MTWSDIDGAIDFGWGRCTLRADDHALVLHAEAHDDATLRRLQALLSARLHQFGRRDDLIVTWQSVPTPIPAASADRPHDADAPGRHRPRRQTVVLVSIGALVVALHVGLGAAAIAAPIWAGWALDVILAVVVVKLLASILLGRHLLRHQRRSAPTTPDPPQ